MRTASKHDADVISACVLKVARCVGATANDPYANGLDSLADDEAGDYVRDLFENKTGFAFLEERNGEVIGCICGSIGLTSFMPSGIGQVGRIDVLWVDEDFRGSGIASSLVGEAEGRFRESGVSNVELSYLAGNELAANVWLRLGYHPFRVFSFKQLPSA